MESESDKLLKLATKQLRGSTRRIFIAEVCDTLCDGSARKTEERFGWGRDTVEKGIADRALTPEERASRPSSANKGRMAWEKRNPQMAMDIRLIVEPHTQSDPELKSERCYTNFSAAEVLAALQEKGYAQAQLPTVRTMRNILNRMNYRLKRIQKGKPLKKTKDTDAIFDNVQSARSTASGDPNTLEISIDTKTKVKLGEYSQGGKNQNR